MEIIAENSSDFEVKVLVSNKKKDYTSEAVIIKANESAKVNFSLGDCNIRPTVDSHFRISQKKLEGDEKCFAFYLTHDFLLEVYKV